MDTQKVGLLLKALILASIVTGVVLYYNNTVKKDQLDSFNVTQQEMLKDLDGKMAQLPYGQVWPFDVHTQGVVLNVVAKKQHDGYVMVLVDVRATADVPKDQLKDQKDKTPATTNKEKLPNRIRLGGYAKLTYENIGTSWYLVSVDSVSLKATPD